MFLFIYAWKATPGAEKVMTMWFRPKIWTKIATQDAGRDWVFVHYCFHLEKQSPVLENWTVFAPYRLNGNCNARCWNNEFVIVPGELNINSDSRCWKEKIEATRHLRNEGSHPREILVPGSLKQKFPKLRLGRQELHFPQLRQRM